MTLRCYHDLPSLASAVAVLRLQRLADEGLQVVFEGFETRPGEEPLPVTIDVLDELSRWRERARTVGLAARRPCNVPPTADVHLLGALAGEAGLGASWREVSYRAYWEQAADLSDRATLLDLAEAAGLGRVIAAQRLDDVALRARFRATVARRRAAGVGGVPVLDADGTLVPADLDDDQLRALAGG